MIVYLDTETRSDVDINCGVSAYVNSKCFAVLLLQYAIDDGDVQVWEVARGWPMPKELREAYANPETIFVIHNSSFDRTVINKAKLFDTPLTPERIHDTMVMALAHGYPGSLAALCEVFNLPVDEAKDRNGKRLIRLFCTPRLMRSSNEITFHSWQSKPTEWYAFIKYGISDISSMRAIYKRLPKFNYPRLEHSLWCLDQKINERGIPVDVEMARKAIDMVRDERSKLNKRVQALTNGMVDSATQRDALLNAIEQLYDVNVTSLRSKDILDELETKADQYPPEVQELLEIRRQVAMNSSAKYQRILDMAVDGRMTYSMQMYGASRTGRDAGRGLQPQNLRRPSSWKKETDIDSAIERDITAVKDGSLPLVVDSPLDVIADLVRSVIVAPEGKKLVCADLSNIEGRTLTWLAGEDWKLDYFRRYDRGEEKYDNYQVAYSKAMNVPLDKVGKSERQIGKVQELGLGYAGGISAFLQFANVYRLDLDKMADAVWKTGDKALLNKCYDQFDWAKDRDLTAGLKPRAFSACEYLKRVWRIAHPKTVQFWSALEDAFEKAMTNPGERYTVSKLTFIRQGSHLFIRLPSGRVLTYLHPKRDDDGNLSFMGVNQFTRKWERIKTYSGKLAENVTSATARDILLHRMPMIEEAGYEIILRVHDELVCVAPDDPKYNAEHLASMMATPFDWCSDLPLAAAGFEAHRYRKD